jgi:YD repeat-containing protein
VRRRELQSPRCFLTSSPSNLAGKCQVVSELSSSRGFAPHSGIRRFVIYFVFGSIWGLSVLQLMRRLGQSAAFFVFSCCFALATVPTISSISPNPGGIGQSVTISGTNFGSSGSVTFNAVPATTTSWNSTAIVATVPVGASTGNVVVTSGGQSSNGFLFTLNNGPVNYVYDDLGRLVAVIDVSGNAAEYSYDAVGNILSISRYSSSQVSIIDFSPESGPIGTVVTINGTGFSTTLSQNTVKFNGLSATVTSATNTQLQATVPTAATTGTISVTSPNGTATSTAAFNVTSSNGVPTITSFSPASGIAGTTVNLTGTNFDTTLTNDELLLNATHAVVSTATSTTIATTVPAATASGHFTLLAPAGNAVSAQDFYVPFGSHVAADIGLTARITPGGSQPVTLAAGKIGLVLFDGMAGEHVDIVWSGTTYSSCNLYLIAPNNLTIATTLCTSGQRSDLGTIALPSNGTYTIGIDSGTSSGSVTVALSADIVENIYIDGPAVQVTTTIPGQDARLIFTATAGRRIFVYATCGTNPYATLNLLTPTGSIQAPIIICNGAGPFYIDTQTLAAAGTYQLWVQHSGTNVGSETLQIISVPADFTATLTVPAPGTTGTAVQTPSLVVGQNASLTFSGTQGQQLSFNMSSTIGTSSVGCFATLYDPSHVIVFSNVQCGNGSTYIDTVTLGSTGTYTLYLNPFGEATGSISVSINNAQDVTTPAISIGGSALTYATTVYGQDVRLSFAGTMGQQIAVYATGVSNPYASLNLLTPTGAIQAVIVINNTPNAVFFMDTQKLATTGTYQLQVQHSGINIGSETLQIIAVPADFTGTLTVPAAGAQGTATRVPASNNLGVGQNASLTFSGTAAQKLSFNFLSTIGSNYSLCLVTVTGPSPSTTQIAQGYCGYQASGPDFIDTITIPTTGTYTVYLNPLGTAVGNVSVSINNDQDVTTPTISIGGSAVLAKTTVAGQDVRLSFTPTASQPRIFVLAGNVTNPSATLNLWNGTSTQALTAINNNPSGQTFYIDTQAVNANQQYQLWVQHSVTNFGNESLQIKTVAADLSHTVTVGGTAYTFSTATGQNANITFTINTSESVTVHWTSGTYPSTLGCNVKVTGPSPSTNQVGSGSCNTTTGTVSLGTLSSGTYNILIDPQAQSAGGMSLTVTTP